MFGKMKFSKGNEINGYVVIKAKYLEELCLTVYQLSHEKSGATVIHFSNSDTENLFCLSLKTIPKDSTGVAHILEHTVLCGSKKFPVKDPFFSMNRRSLNTFMNAMTGSDFTCYPAASTLKKDFYNLMEVYIDAVFFPTLDIMSFYQEGHRLEFDPYLKHKGVVFNEMKGSLSNPEARLWQEITKYLTPDLTYSYNSGGDPLDIPNLTYQQLKEFHAKHYHPSRCIFFFYGNIPLESHLKFLSKNILDQTEKIQPLQNNFSQKRFTKPTTKVGYYPSTSGGDFISFSWLTAPVSNSEDILSLTIIDSLLMETDASPLRKALIESGLCTQADGFLDTEMSEVPYTIICKGCDGNNAEALQQVLFKELEAFIKDPICEDKLEAAIHQLEFSKLEITDDYGPYGLTLYMRSILPMHHGCDLETNLLSSQQFDDLRTKLTTKNAISSIVNKYLIRNTHFLTYTLKKDAALGQKIHEEEETKLKEIEKSLDNTQRDKIIKTSKDLSKYQAECEKQPIDCLPKLNLSDIPTRLIDYPLTHIHDDKLEVFHHDCSTNDIVYAKLVYPLHATTEDDLPYLKLISSIIPLLGNKKRNYIENLEYINAYIGDFSCSLNLNPQISDPNNLNPTFSLKGKVLNRNIDKLFHLFVDTLSEIQLSDALRIKQLILQIHNALEARISKNAMGYAIQKSVASYSQSSYLSDSMSGVEYYSFIKNLVNDLNKKLPVVISKLKSIAKSLVHRNNPELVLSCNSAQLKHIQKYNYFDIPSLDTSEYNEWQTYHLPNPVSSRAYIISSPVAFSAYGLHTENINDSLSSALSISTQIIENTYLHKKIREQGGAYGSGVSYNHLSGNYILHSYRDPHIKRSFEVFKQSFEDIYSKSINEQDLVDAKMTLLQDIDAPVSPGSRAELSYSFMKQGYTQQIRSMHRNGILNVSKEQLKQAAEYLLSSAEGVEVTFASADLVKKEASGMTVITI